MPKKSVHSFGEIMSDPRLIFTSEKNTRSYCSKVKDAAVSLYPLVPEKVVIPEQAMKSDFNLVRDSTIEFAKFSQLSESDMKATYKFVTNLLQTGTNTAKSFIMSVPEVSLMYINDSELAEIFNKNWEWFDVEQLIESVINRMLSKRHAININNYVEVEYTFKYKIDKDEEATLHNSRNHAYVRVRKNFLLACNISKILTVVDEFDSLIKKLVLEKRIV